MKKTCNNCGHSDGIYCEEHAGLFCLFSNPRWSGAYDRLLENYAVDLWIPRQRTQTRQISHTWQNGPNGKIVEFNDCHLYPCKDTAQGCRAFGPRFYCPQLSIPDAETKDIGGRR